MSTEDFILGMLSLGTPVEMSLVGSFEPSGTKGRGSRRDMPLPLHRDGVFSSVLAAVQGGHYVENPNVDLVGLYCLRSSPEPCYTILADDSGKELFQVSLETGEALIFDNHAVLHGREGPVGQRILIRFWIKKKEIL